MDVTIKAPAPQAENRTPERDARRVDDGPRFEDILAREPERPEPKARPKHAEKPRKSEERRPFAERDLRADEAGAQSVAAERGPRSTERVGAKLAGVADGVSPELSPLARTAWLANLKNGPEVLQQSIETFSEVVGEAPLAERLARQLLARQGQVDPALAFPELAANVDVEGEGDGMAQILKVAVAGDEPTVDLANMLRGLQPDVPEVVEAPAPRPIGLQASTVSGTRHGEGLATRLPAGVDESSVLRQITDGMKLRDLGRRKEVEIRLDPPELGKVTVRMQMEAGTARIVVGAEHAAVVDLLSQQMEELRRQLMAQGVQVEHFEVSQQAADDGGPGGDAREDGDPAAEEAVEDVAQGRAPPRRKHGGRISVTA